MATAAGRSARIRPWVSAGAPLVAVAAMVALFLAFDPIGRLREVPPVEALAFEQVVFERGEIAIEIRNDGPDPVTIAQVLVNDAYTSFTMEERTLGRLRSGELTVHYPWEPGLPVSIALLTSTGVTIEHDVDAASLTPRPDASTLAIYGLLGVYIGVVPVAIGLLWFPALKAASARWIRFFLAFTVGLLAFLLVDTVTEGIELAGATATSLNGLGLFAIGAVLAVAVLSWFESTLEGRRPASRGSGLLLAYLIASGIGLHNLGEGLAVGAALAAGEIALGTYLILGFALHNTTEGLAIVAPLGAEPKRPLLRHFVALGAVAGVPTIGGAWIGGFMFAPAFAALAFGLAAGAIAQVVWKIGRTSFGSEGIAAGLPAAGLALGLVFMYATGLLTS